MYQKKYEDSYLDKDEQEEEELRRKAAAAAKPATGITLLVAKAEQYEAEGDMAQALLATDKLTEFSQ